MKCKKCGRELQSDEIALYRKIVSRWAEEFLCIECIAEHFGITVGDCEKMIEDFKRTGCALFC